MSAWLPTFWVQNLEEKIAAGEEEIRVKKLQINEDNLKVDNEIFDKKVKFKKDVNTMKDNLDKEIGNMTDLKSQRAEKVKQDCLTISAKVKEFKNRKAGIEEAVKKPQQKRKYEIVENGDMKIRPNNDFTKFLKNSIATKERELECPICLEVASTPIFCCSNSHLICGGCCKETLKICPVCNVEMGPCLGNRRYRDAEEKVEEVRRFKIQLEQISQ